MTWQEKKMGKRKYNNAKDVSILDAGVIIKQILLMVMIKQTTQKTKVKKKMKKKKKKKT